MCDKNVYHGNMKFIHLRQEMGNTLITLQSLNNNEEKTNFEFLSGCVLIRLFDRCFGNFMQIHEDKG